MKKTLRVLKNENIEEKTVRSKIWKRRILKKTCGSSSEEVCIGDSIATSFVLLEPSDSEIDRFKLSEAEDFVFRLPKLLLFRRTGAGGGGGDGDISGIKNDQLDPIGPGF